VAVELPELMVEDAGAWRSWLGRHHVDSAGVWLVLAKKGTTEPTRLSYDQALEEALCHGWIDGQLGRRDQVTYRQRFTPRGARSRWSKRNVAIVERLTVEGRMHPAGLAAAEQARGDGRWEAAYAGSREITVPDDLAIALRANQAAQVKFDRLSSRNPLRAPVPNRQCAAPRHARPSGGAVRGDAGTGRDHLPAGRVSMQPPSFATSARRSRAVQVESFGGPEVLRDVGLRPEPDAYRYPCLRLIQRLGLISAATT
jgi:uncharacterized protein YdeI (YjbR/CyaY-like superfamily)